jgi:hypothetical protein
MVRTSRVLANPVFILSKKLIFAIGTPFLCDINLIAAFREEVKPCIMPFLNQR